MHKHSDLLNFIKRKSVCRVREIEKGGFRRIDLAVLLNSGKIQRVARGVYQISGAPVLPNQSYAELAIRSPNSVICLMSALQFHNVTTQLPHEIWCAIEGTNRAPRITYPKIKIVRLVGKAFTEGVEIHKINGIPIKVYSVAKTVADLFRFRNKVGLDVAMEALREAIRTKKVKRDEIYKMAKLRGVYSVMRPYMEMEAVT